MGEVYFTQARLVSVSEVQCEMPFSVVEIEIEWTSITWLVSVSNDNVTFSDKTTVFVFDSKCLSCTTDSSSCTQKVSCCDWKCVKGTYDWQSVRSYLTQNALNLNVFLFLINVVVWFY